MTNSYTTERAFKQLESCNFECEAGPLAKNTAFQWLANHLSGREAPAFLPGQKVWMLVEAEVHGVKLSKWAPFFVGSIHVSSSSERRTWTYSLWVRLPEAYYSGDPGPQTVKECDLHEADPSQ